MCYKYWANPKTRLILYVSSAILAALLSDLSHYQCHDLGFSAISPIKLTCIIINVILQGIIAWRAFIDDSNLGAEEDVKSKLILEKNKHDS